MSPCVALISLYLIPLSELGKSILASCVGNSAMISHSLVVGNRRLFAMICVVFG